MLLAICQHLLHDRSAHKLCIRLVNTILVFEAVEVRPADGRPLKPAARRTSTIMRTEIRGHWSETFPGSRSKLALIRAWRMAKSRTKCRQMERHLRFGHERSLCYRRVGQTACGDATTVNQPLVCLSSQNSSELAREYNQIKESWQLKVE